MTVTLDNWRCFCEEWGCSKDKGISAVIEYDNNGEDDSMCSKGILVCNNQLESIDAPNDRFDERRLVIRTSPEVHLLSSFVFPLDLGFLFVDLF